MFLNKQSTRFCFIFQPAYEEHQNWHSYVNIRNDACTTTLKQIKQIDSLCILVCDFYCEL